MVIFMKDSSNQLRMKLERFDLVKADFYHKRRIEEAFMNTMVNGLMTSSMEWAHAFTKMAIITTENGGLGQGMVWARWLRALEKLIMVSGKMIKNMARVHFGLLHSQSLSVNSSTTKRTENLKHSFLMVQSRQEYGKMMLKRAIQRLCRSHKLASRMIQGQRK